MRRPELLRESLTTAGLLVRGPAELALKAGLAAALAWVLARLARGRGAGVMVLAAWLVLVEVGLRRTLVRREVPVPVAELERLARPGDLLLCRSYRAADLFEVLVFRHLAAVLAADREFHTHVGIVVERDGRKFVLDSLADPSFSWLTRARKASGVTMRPLAEWAEAYSGRVRLYASARLRAAVDNDRLLDYAHRVRHEPFTYVLGGLSCLDTVAGALRDQGLFVRPPAVLTPGHLADAGLYAVPGVRFTRYVVDNAWRRRAAGE
jgi:hypothetical protein